MLSMSLRRLLSGIPTLFALATISFFLMRVAPGGPFSGNRRLPADVIANMKHAYHLDDPLWLQFARFLWNGLHLDLGPSMSFRDYSVVDLIAQGFPASMEIGLAAMALASVVGLSLGIAGALRRNGAIDYLAGLLAIVGVAVPIFVIGPLLQLVFGLQLAWLPVAGWSDWHTKILPIVTLSLPNIAYISRLMRGSMIETLRANYVRTAKAKGLGPIRTLAHHAFQGAILPVVAYLGPATAITITGSVVIEQIFQVPGIGRYFVIGASNRDYTLVMGVTLFYGSIVIIANIVTDVARGILDPRVRYG
jgi:oligopeptide transport system permease protein